MSGLRLLVLDAYAPEGRAALEAAGGTEAGQLYQRMLIGLAPDIAWTGLVPLSAPKASRSAVRPD